MYIKLKRGVLKRLVEKALYKAGNIRNLEKEIHISKSSLSAYHLEKRAIRDKNLKNLTNFIKTKIKSKEIEKRFPDNWKQIKGGKNCVIKKIKDGKLKKQLEIARIKASISTSKWHKMMKKNRPEEYYNIQYEKFKKIGGYKFLTKNGTKVRNKLERDVADLLTKMKINYEYEPLIKSDNKYFFPDFVLNNKTILECTMWKGYDKAKKLKDKIKHLKKTYKVYVIIPKALNNYYKILNNNLVLGLEEFVPLAQTFQNV